MPAVLETNFLPFECGSKFSSYSDFEKAKEEYENKNFAVLVKCKSEKFPEGHKHRENLIYKCVIFECKKGPNHKSSTSKGIRPNVTTGKLGCNFKLKLRTNGGFLVVKESNLEHSNHELSEERFWHLPEKLRLNAEEMKEAELCLKSGGNKKKIQAHLMQQRDGKPVILKTLHNISSKLQKNEHENGHTDLEKMIESMKAIPDAVINIAYEQDTKELIGVYFQDKRMKAIFEKFPEVLIFDATYKLNNYKLPLFVLLAIDGNGESEVVALFVIQSESKMCVGTMLDFFKSNNEAWVKVEVLIGDKDFADRKVFEEKFPSAKIQICLFHALRTFKREVPLKLGELNTTLKKHVLEIFTDLAYSESEETYNIHYSKLISLNVQDLTEYYEKNWHSIKDEWVLYEQNRHFIIKNRTTNRLESLNQKLKSVVARYCTLGKFFHDIIISVVSTNVERDHKAITMVEKMPINSQHVDEVEKKIRNHLTAYSANHVCSEYHKSSKMIFTSIENDIHILKKPSAVIKATYNYCDCGSISSMGLPCRHIMAVRRLLNLPIYEESLSRNRWTRSYYLASHPVFKDLKAIGNFKITHKPKAECDKYCEASKTTKNIISVLSTLPNDKYDYYLNKLKEFESLLCSEKLMIISEYSSEEILDQQNDTPPENTNSEILDQEHDVPRDFISATCIGEQVDNPPAVVASSSTIVPNCELSAIKLKKPIKKQGNPKGYGQTVIGLDRGKKRKKTVYNDIFENKSETEKALTVLKYFVDPEVAKRAISGILIEENEVSVIPQIVPMQRMRDDRVNVESIRNFFQPDAFMIIQQLNKAVVSMGWKCCDCLSDLNGNAIQCDLCLDWYNWTCQKITVCPPSKYWFCSNCRLG